MFFNFRSTTRVEVVKAGLADLTRYAGDPDDEAIVGAAAGEFAQDARLHPERYAPYGHVASRLLTGIPAPVVFDGAAGSGEVALAIARRLPQARVTGFDISASMLAEAERNRVARDQRNVSFLSADLRETASVGMADLVVSRHAIHRVEDLSAVLGAALAGVKPGGYCLVSGFRRATDLSFAGQENFLRAIEARADLPALRLAFVKAHVNAPCLADYQRALQHLARQGKVCCYKIREGVYNNVHLLIRKPTL